MFGLRMILLQLFFLVLLIFYILLVTEPVDWCGCF